ncbi:MAG: hypothetical protein EPO24_00895, partial [Bacteroidetes bacterium]
MSHTMSFRLPEKLPQLIVACSMLALLCAIWLNTYLPLQDYPEWLFQGKTLHAALTDTLDSESLYAVRWFPIPPNALVSILLALLNFFMPIEIAGKVMLSAYLLLFISGWRFMFRTANHAHPFRWLGVLLAFNFFFYMGLLGYTASIAVLFFAVPWLFSLKAPFSPNHGVKIALLSLSLYLLHGVAFGIFILAILV